MRSALIGRRNLVTGGWEQASSESFNDQRSRANTARNAPPRRGCVHIVYRPECGSSAGLRAPRRVGFRRSQISVRLRAFRLRRPQCAQGRHVLPGRSHPGVQSELSHLNSLNIFILRGDGAQCMELTFASLMTRANDEPDALYGLAARAVQISADGLTYRFLMRPGITFHDGSPLTAHDVAFSLKILKDKGHPIAQQLLRDFVGAEAADDATVVAHFAPNRARDVPLF